MGMFWVWHMYVGLIAPEDGVFATFHEYRSIHHNQEHHGDIWRHSDSVENKKE